MRFVKLIAKLVAGIVAIAIVLVGGYAAANWAPDRPVDELKARWAQPPSTFVRVAGMDVHIRDEGPRDDPSPIVLLHGTSASLHTWEGWSRALTQKRRVIRFDLPGFGLTGPTPDGNYSIQNDVRFVIAMLDALGVRHCVLAGNSLGGSIAWMTALSAPERVDRLILVDAGGYPQRSTSVPIGFRIARSPPFNRLAEVILPRSMIESSIRNVYGHPEKVTPELVDLFYDMAVREGNRRALAQRMTQTPVLSEVKRLGELKLPTLILWGGRDRLRPIESARWFQRDIRDSQLVIFDDLGHVPHEEDPERTVVAVTQFLSRD